MNELSPDQASEHQASVAQAQQAARELEEVRQKLEEQHKANEEKLKKELEGFLISWVFFRFAVFKIGLSTTVYKYNFQIFVKGCLFE